MSVHNSDDLFEIYSRFGYGKNQAFDDLVKTYTTESAAALATGKPVMPFNEYVMAWVAESNKAYSHSEFVTAIRGKVITIRWLVEPYKLIRDRKGNVFAILGVLYQVAPLIVFPLCAYLAQNWWFILGAVLSYAASRFAAQNYHANTETRPTKGFAIFLCLLTSALAVLLFIKDFHEYYFWPFAALWGFTFYILAELAQMTYAIRSLVESPEHFYSAISANRLMIERTT